MKNYNDLMRLIYTNGGATLSIDQKTNELVPVEYDSGYQVAYQHNSVCLRMDYTTPTTIFLEVIDLKRIVQDIYNNGPALNIGVWLNNGYLYIDISINIMNLSTAQELGLYEHQKAIYDWRNKKDIVL